MIEEIEKSHGYSYRNRKGKQKILFFAKENNQSNGTGTKNRIDKLSSPFDSFT